MMKHHFENDRGKTHYCGGCSHDWYDCSPIGVDALTGVVTK